MNLLNLAYTENMRFRRPPRVFFNRCHFDEDGDFVQRYRLNAETVNYIVQRFSHRLQCSNRTGALSQVLTTLSFLATNSFYHVLRDAHGPFTNIQAHYYWTCRAHHLKDEIIHFGHFDLFAALCASCPCIIPFANGSPAQILPLRVVKVCHRFAITVGDHYFMYLVPLNFFNFSAIR